MTYVHFKYYYQKNRTFWIKFLTNDETNIVNIPGLLTLSCEDHHELLFK